MIFNLNFDINEINPALTLIKFCKKKFINISVNEYDLFVIEDQIFEFFNELKLMYENNIINHKTLHQKFVQLSDSDIEKLNLFVKQNGPIYQEFLNTVVGLKF